MYANVNEHLEPIKKIFSSIEDVKLSTVALNENFIVLDADGTGEQFYVGFLSNANDGTGIDLENGLFLNKRIAVPNTVDSRNFINNIELYKTLGFNNGRLGVVSLDTLNATSEEEEFPASSKAIKSLKQQLDNLVIGNFPPASENELGAVIIGDGIDVDVNGKIKTKKIFNTKGSEMLTSTGNTFLLNTGVNVLNRNVDFNIEISLMNPTNNGTKLFVSGSHLFLENTIANFKGFSDGNITSVKSFVKGELLFLYIESLCNSIVCDKIDAIERNNPETNVYSNYPMLTSETLPTENVSKLTTLNLKKITFDLLLSSNNDGITYNNGVITLNTINELTNNSPTKPASSNTVKTLNEIKYNKRKLLAPNPGCNLDTIITDGFYKGYNPINGPSGVELFCLNVEMYSEDWIIQKLSHTNRDGIVDIYVREFHSGTTWGSWVKIIDSTGGVLTGTITAVDFLIASDKNLKENILLNNNLKEKLLKLNVYDFRMKEDGTEQTGLIAQEVQKELPNFVSTFEKDGTEFLNVAYARLGAIASIVALKEIEKLREEFKPLKHEVFNSRKNI